MEGGKPSQEESYPRIRFIRITFLPLYRLYQRLTSRLREPKFTWLEVLAWMSEESSTSHLRSTHLRKKGRENIPSVGKGGIRKIYIYRERERKSATKELGRKKRRKGHAQETPHSFSHLFLPPVLSLPCQTFPPYPWRGISHFFNPGAPQGERYIQGGAITIVTWNRRLFYRDAKLLGRNREYH